MKIDNFFNKNPYNLDSKLKKKDFNKYINFLTKFHFNNCSDYNKILKFFKYKVNKNYILENLPFLPVQIFKELDLSSVSKNKVIKIMRSSGTSTGIASKIFLDKINAANQVNALKNIFQFNFGIIPAWASKRSSTRFQISSKESSAAVCGSSIAA